jgi:hypothetical protein
MSIELASLPSVHEVDRETIRAWERQRLDGNGRCNRCGSPLTACPTCESSVCRCRTVLSRTSFRRHWGRDSRGRLVPLPLYPERAAMLAQGVYPEWTEPLRRRRRRS